MFKTRMLFFALLLTFCAASMAITSEKTEKTEKDWLSGILKWDAWNTPFSKTSQKAEMIILGKDSMVSETVCERKKESLNNITKDIRITDVYYIYHDVYKDGVTVSDKWLSQVILKVNDEDSYADDGIYQDYDVVADKLSRFIGRDGEYGDGSWYCEHVIKHKLDGYGMANETISVGYDDEGVVQIVVGLVFWG